MKTGTISPEMKFESSIKKRLFIMLLALVAFGLLALVPYGLTLAGQEIDLTAIAQLPFQFLSQIVLYGALIWIGLGLSRRVGLQLPILSRLASKSSPDESRKMLKGSLIIGLFTGLSVILLDVFIFVPNLGAELQILGESVQPPAWQGFLAAFYGGIVEEVMMRLFMMSLLVWLGGLLFHDDEGRPSNPVFWAAILISGLAFGIAHFPAATALGIPLSPLYITRTLVLNGVGILYGWLYWKRGLESAMLTHFATDLMIHVFGALLLG